MSWSKQEVLAFLDERPRVGRLATVTASGEPRVVPVWFRTRDDKVLVHTGSGMAKARNVEATGRYAIAVDDDVWPYRGVSVRGSARLVDPEATVGDLREFMTDMAVAYLGADAGVPMGASLSDPSWPHTIIELTIEQWISFDYSS
jgi:PPOX class probable F420-dependent enzyme